MIKKIKKYHVSVDQIKIKRNKLLYKKYIERVKVIIFKLKDQNRQI